MTPKKTSNIGRTNSYYTDQRLVSKLLTSAVKRNASKDYGMTSPNISN